MERASNNCMISEDMDMEGLDEIEIVECMFQFPVGKEIYVNGSNMISPMQITVGSNEASIEYPEAPKVGMVFKTWEEVELFYKNYARQQGFGVSRMQGAFDKTKERRGTTWRCECWGKPDMRARREAKKRAKTMEVGGASGVIDGGVGCKTKSKKCECPALVYASVNGEGEWEVRRVILEHLNHNPTPSKAMLVKEYRMKSLTKRVRRKLLNEYEGGSKISQIPLTVKDLCHVVDEERKLKIEGSDCKAMMAYFDSLQSDNQNFYHAIRFDEEGRMKEKFY